MGLELGYNWFGRPPVHPRMSELDKELALEALPIALEVTLNQLREPHELTPYEKLVLGIGELSKFEPQDNDSKMRTREEFFGYIEGMLKEGVKRTEGIYRKDIYVIEAFPLSRTTLTIDDYIKGPGMIVLLNEGGWRANMKKEIFESIPEKPLQQLTEEFKLLYEFKDYEDNPHYLFYQDPAEVKRSWYIKDAYQEQKLFAENLLVAYTNLFLKWRS